MHGIQDNLDEALKTLQLFIENKKNIESIEHAGAMMVHAMKADKKIISCGNGGSMCDAMHFAQEMTGRYKDYRKALPAIAISDPAHLSCTANDFGYAQVFSKYIEALGHEGDILLAISTSGNSENILNAVDAARSQGMKVIGLTGKDGGKLGPLCDIEIRAPHTHYADRAQEIHIKVIHCLLDYIEKAMFKE
jgi:D-sedoheptulose 7-phosphate isomerase